jgi:hypothetical protein
MSNPPNEPVRFVTCRCQHCDGHIEFDAGHAGESVACPHCGLETKLFLPPAPAKPTNPNSPNAISKNVNVEIKRGANPLGIASLVLGIVACVFCWIPFLGLLAIPISAIGFLLAIAGIIMAAVSKKTGFAFPISGLLVCVLSMFIAFAVTGSLATIIQQAVTEGKQTNQKWSKSDVVRQGDLQIKVEGGSEFERVNVESPGEPGGVAVYEHFFTIHVVVSNLSKTKKIDFTTWRGKDFSVRDYATLSDDNGNEYKRMNFGFKAIKKYGFQGAQNYENEASIYPQESFEDLLVFEKPVENRKWLHLELPASNFGGSGMIRFEIPVK